MSTTTITITKGTKLTKPLTLDSASLSTFAEGHKYMSDLFFSTDGSKRTFLEYLHRLRNHLENCSIRTPWLTIEDVHEVRSLFRTKGEFHADHMDILGKYSGETTRPFTGVMVEVYRAHPTQANASAIRAAASLLNRGCFKPAFEGEQAKAAQWAEDCELMTTLNYEIQTESLNRHLTETLAEAKAVRGEIEEKKAELESVRAKRQKMVEVVEV